MGEIIWHNNIIRSLANKLSPNSNWGYTLFAFFLPFPIPVSRIFIFVLLFSWLINFKSKKVLYHPKPEFAQYLLPILFGVYATSLAYTDDLYWGFRQLEKALPMLLVSVAFIFKNFDERELAKILKAFILGLLVMCIFLLGKALYNSLYWENGGLIFDPRVLRDTRITYIHSVNWGGNYFFSDAFIDFMNPSYFGMYLVFSFGCLFYLRRSRSISWSTTLIVGLVFTFILFFASARASHLSLVIIVLLTLFIDDTFSKRSKVYSLLILVVVFFIFIILNPRWVEFSGIQDMMAGKIEYKGSVPERIMTWDASIRLITENIFFGYGIGDVQSELNRMYSELNYKRVLEESYNAHNQFLQTLLIAGVFGFIVLIFAFVRLMTVFQHTKHILILIFVVVTVIHFSFESMLERYAGVVFLSFFYGLFNSLDLNANTR